MELNDYQRTAMKSIAIKEKNLAALAHRTLGITGESGELANVIKKIIRDKSGQPTDDDIQLISEKLGDVLYYVSALADYFVFDLEEIAEKNIKKSKAFKAAREN